jgi:hypothetical protein
VVAAGRSLAEEAHVPGLVRHDYRLTCLAPRQDGARPREEHHERSPDEQPHATDDRPGTARCHRIRGGAGGVSATLTLTFTPAPGGCDVGVDFRITGRGLVGPAMAALSLASRPAVRADLRRAARILAG